MNDSSCNYCNRAQAVGSSKTRTHFILFGQFLCRQGLITYEQVIKARAMQLRQNQKIGILAKQKGFMSDEDIQRVLIIQEETLKKFGEISVEMGLLNNDQVRALLAEQEDNYLFFGEALIQMGAMTEAAMFDQLKAFNALKLEKQLEQENIKRHSAESRQG